MQYSSSEKYLFEITNICVWLIHAVHYFFIILFLLFFYFPCAFPPSELYLLAEAVELQPGSGGCAPAVQAEVTSPFSSLILGC